MKYLVFTLLFFGLAWAQPVNIEVWHSLSNTYGAPEFEGFVAEFNESQSDIQVDVVYAGGYTDALRKAQAAVAAGKAPNLVMFEQTRGAGFVDAEAILPLDPFIEANPNFNLDDFYQRLLSTCSYGEELYCLPYNTSTPVVYYNADMLRLAGIDPEDFPSTWDELLEVGPELAKLNDAGELEQWAIGLTTSPGWLFDAFMGQAGGSFLNEDGSAFIFNGEPSLEMMAFWQEIIDTNTGKTSSSQTEDFFGGKQAIIINSTAVLESYFERATFDLQVAPLLCNVTCYAPIGGANFYLMDTGSEAQQQAAWTFLTWVTAPERFAEFAAATGYMAGRKSALETDTMVQRFESRPAARVTYDQMAEYGHPRTLVPFWGEVHSLLTQATEEVLLGGVPAQQALDSAVEEANRLLEVYAR